MPDFEDKKRDRSSESTGAEEREPRLVSEHRRAAAQAAGSAYIRQLIETDVLQHFVHGQLTDADHRYLAEHARPDLADKARDAIAAGRRLDPAVAGHRYLPLEKKVVALIQDSGPSTMVEVEEPAVVEVTRGDKLPGGRTRDDQLRDTEQATQAAKTYVFGIIALTSPKIDAQLKEFKTRIPAHRVHEEQVPGAWLLQMLAGKVIELLKSDIPFLGLVPKAVSVFKDALPDGPELNVDDVGEELIKASSKIWAEGSNHTAEIVGTMKVGVHEAYAAAPVGKGSAAVEAYLASQGIVAPDVSNLCASLEQKLDEIVFQWRCRNDTMFAMARAEACAADKPSE